MEPLPYALAVFPIETDDSPLAVAPAFSALFPPMATAFRPDAVVFAPNAIAYISAPVAVVEAPVMAFAPIVREPLPYAFAVFPMETES